MVCKSLKRSLAKTHTLRLTALVSFLAPALFAPVACTSKLSTAPQTNSASQSNSGGFEPKQTVDQVDRYEFGLTQTLGERVLFEKQDEKRNQKTYKFFNQYLSNPKTITSFRQSIKAVKIQEPEIKKIAVKLYWGNPNRKHNSKIIKGELTLAVNTALGTNSIKTYISSLNYSQFVFDLERRTKDCDFSIIGTTGKSKRKIVQSLQSSIKLLENLDCSQKKIDSINIRLGDATGHHDIKTKLKRSRISLVASLGNESVREYLFSVICANPNLTSSETTTGLNPECSGVTSKLPKNVAH